MTVGMLQMAVTEHLEVNREKICHHVALGADRGCQVVVFPEGALDWSPEATVLSEVDRAIDAIRERAARCNVHVIVGFLYRDGDPDATQPHGSPARQYNAMVAFRSDGSLLQRVSKLSDSGGAGVAPGLVYIEGVPCNIVVCSDRWLRAVQELPVMAGSKVIFEIANGGMNGWSDELGWFRYVPLAERTSSWVVVCNTSQMPLWYPAWPGKSSLRYQDLAPDMRPPRGHGHCAVIDPHGSMVLAEGGADDVFRVVELDLSQADQAMAKQRQRHASLRHFWDLGVEIMESASTPAPADTPPQLHSTSRSITVAAAQIASTLDPDTNCARIEAQSTRAAEGGAELVVFPELAVTGAGAVDLATLDESTLDRYRQRVAAAAAGAGIAVAAGMPWQIGDEVYDSAFVFDSHGRELTRYDRVSTDGAGPFTASRDLHRMWFELDGIWGVVTLGSDVLWTELAELAAVAGAQLHLHLGYDPCIGPDAARRRTQRWIHLARYRTLTVTTNAARVTGISAQSHSVGPADGGSAIWCDLYREPSDPGDVEMYLPYHANCVAQAGTGQELILATRTVNERNPHFDAAIRTRNPQMINWYATGARALAPRGAVTT